MAALLDTNSFLWFIAGDEKLSRNAQQFISNPDNDLFLSVVSLWEIAIKVSIGKLELLHPFNQLFPEQLAENSIDLLTLKLNHLFILLELPLYHRDPFDRLIISQGIKENLPVISGDKIFQQYPVEVIW
ncbi:type II toxin-antitoxin system VapC family toxin [Candidatus Poribacteria bacterium]|nr:type II toxin-antitoxin system VapC family toxin [Candidatus Poribacteria bacterium]